MLNKEMAVNVPQAKELAKKVSDSVQNALRGARKECGSGLVYRSRGKWYRVLSANDSILDNGCLEFKGTQKQLEEVLAKYTAMPEAVSIYIEGGVDASSSVRDFYDGDYTPWVTEWAVDVWKKPEA